MKRLLHILLIVILAMPAISQAQSQVGDGRVPYYKGYKWRVDAEGDSMLVLYLTDLYVYPTIKFKNAKQRQQYDRLTRNVKITLPYAKLIAETLVETYEYIETLPTQKEREEYLSRMEKEIFNQYKPTLKKFSRKQARLLIKLIQRETNQTSYEIVRAFLGSFRATFWQGFGKLFGVSLRGTYDPNGNHDDAMIERIASQVELGIL